MARGPAARAPRDFRARHPPRPRRHVLAPRALLPAPLPHRARAHARQPARARPHEPRRRLPGAIRGQGGAGEAERREKGSKAGGAAPPPLLLRLLPLQDPQPPEAVKLLLAHLPALFMFALVWSVGATANADGRRRFNAFLRQEMAAHSFPFPFPEGAGALVHDFVWDPAAAPAPAAAAAAPAAGGAAAPTAAPAAAAAPTGAWVPWMTTIAAYEYPRGSAVDFSELIIPTKDSVRYKWLSKALLLSVRAAWLLPCLVLPASPPPHSTSALLLPSSPSTAQGRPHDRPGASWAGRRACCGCARSLPPFPPSSPPFVRRARARQSTCPSCWPPTCRASTCPSR